MIMKNGEASDTAVNDLALQFEKLRIPELEVPSASALVLQDRIRRLQHLLDGSTADASDLPPAAEAEALSDHSHTNRTLEAIAGEIALYRQFLQPDALNLDHVLKRVSESSTTPYSPYLKEVTGPRSITATRCTWLDSASHYSVDSVLSEKDEASRKSMGAEDGRPTEESDALLRWTLAAKINSHVYSEEFRETYGLPNVVDARGPLLAVGTSRGHVLIYHHGSLYTTFSNSKLQAGTRSGDPVPVLSVDLSSDLQYVAAGYAAGALGLWSIKASSCTSTIQPIARRRTPWSRNEPPQTQTGHLPSDQVVHVKFAQQDKLHLVSASSKGLAFYHRYTKGMGNAGSYKTFRLFGNPNNQLNRALMTTVFSLVRIETPWKMPVLGLVALSTPFKLVIVRTEPSVKTLIRFPRPIAERAAEPSFVSCIAISPRCAGACQLVGDRGSYKAGDFEERTIACSWGSMIVFLRVRVTPEKPLPVEIISSDIWNAPAPVTSSCCLEDSTFVFSTDVDEVLCVNSAGKILLMASSAFHGKDIFAQDVFQETLSVLKRRRAPEVVTYHSFVFCGGRSIFVLGSQASWYLKINDWESYIKLLSEHGYYKAALQALNALATRAMAGGDVSETFGQEQRKKSIERPMLVLAESYLSKREFRDGALDPDRPMALQEMTDFTSSVIEICICNELQSVLFTSLFALYAEFDRESIFYETLEPFMLSSVTLMPHTDFIDKMVDHYILNKRFTQLEDLLVSLDPFSFNIHRLISICRTFKLYRAMIYIYNHSLKDYRSPLIQLLVVIRDMNSGAGKESADDAGWRQSVSGLERHSVAELENTAEEAAYMVFVYLAFIFTGRAYPRTLLSAEEADRARNEVVNLLFSYKHQEELEFQDGNSNLIGREPFPYVWLLLQFNCEELFKVLKLLMQETENASSSGDMEFEGSRLTQEAIQSGQSRQASRQAIIDTLLFLINRTESSSSFTVRHRLIFSIFLAHCITTYPESVQLSDEVCHNVFLVLSGVEDSYALHQRQRAISRMLDSLPLSHRQRDDIVLLCETRGLVEVCEVVYESEKKFDKVLQTYLSDSSNPERQRLLFPKFSNLWEQDLTENDRRHVVAALSQEFPKLLEISPSYALGLLLKVFPREFMSCYNSIKEIQKFGLLSAMVQLDDSELSKLVPEPAEAQRVVVDYASLLCKRRPEELRPWLTRIYLPSSNALPCLREAVIGGLGDIKRAAEENHVVDVIAWLMELEGNPDGAFRVLKESFREILATCEKGVKATTGLSPAFTGIRYLLRLMVEHCRKLASLKDHKLSLGGDLERSSSQSEVRWFELFRLVLENREHLLPSQVTHLEDDIIRGMSGYVNWTHVLRFVFRSDRNADRHLLQRIMQAFETDRFLFQSTHQLMTADLFQTVQESTRRRERGSRVVSQCYLCDLKLSPKYRKLLRDDEAYDREEERTAPVSSIQGYGLAAVGETSDSAAVEVTGDSGPLERPDDTPSDFQRHLGAVLVFNCHHAAHLACHVRLQASCGHAHQPMLKSTNALPLPRQGSHLSSLDYPPPIDDATGPLVRSNDTRSTANPDEVCWRCDRKRRRLFENFKRTFLHSLRFHILQESKISERILRGRGGPGSDTRETLVTAILRTYKARRRHLDSIKFDLYKTVLQGSSADEDDGEEEHVIHNV